MGEKYCNNFCCFQYSILSDVSGEVSGQFEITDIAVGDTIKFVYTKDASGDKGADTVKFWMMDKRDGTNINEQLFNQLFEVTYPEEYKFVPTTVTISNSKAPGETGGAESVTLTTDNLASHYHGEKIGVPGTSSAQNWGYEKDEGDPIALDYYNVDGVYKVPTDSPVGALITGNSGKNVPFSILPPYYVLCYIMKL